MRIAIFLQVLIFFWNPSEAQEAKTIVYLIPGQGADARQFQKLVVAAGAKAKFVDGSCQAACHVAVQAAYAL